MHVADTRFGLDREQGRVHRFFDRDRTRLGVAAAGFEIGNADLGIAADPHEVRVIEL